MLAHFFAGMAFPPSTPLLGSTWAALDNLICILLYNPKLNHNTAQWHPTEALHEAKSPTFYNLPCPRGHLVTMEIQKIAFQNRHLKKHISLHTS